MPVTKKKGAIFAIYADSPTHPSSSTHTTISIHQSHVSAASPIKRTTARKALSSIQPKVPTGFPSSSGSKVPDEKHDIKGKTTPKSQAPSVNPKPRTSSTRRHNTTVAPPPRTAPSKRQLEIFSSPTIPSSPALPTHPTPSSSHHTHATRQSPAKRGRITPIKPRTDKENQPPSSASIADSPASRTRSKLRMDDLVGDGRGTLSLKKGRTVATLLVEDGAGSSTVARTVTMTETLSVRRMSGKGKGGSVRADGPLADVSEAYGASGIEPEGFRDVRG